MATTGGGHPVDLDVVRHDRASVVNAVSAAGLVDIEWYLRLTSTSSPPIGCTSWRGAGGGGMSAPVGVPDSVRLGCMPGEAASIAAIQRRWQQTQPDVADALLRAAGPQHDDQRLGEGHHDLPLAQFRVLVAVGNDRVAGFAAVGPSDDPDAIAAEDALVAEFADRPAVPAARPRLAPAQRRGRHSAHRRLRARVVVASPTTNDALRRFVTEPGWAADGAHAEMGDPGWAEPDARLSAAELCSTV